MEAFKQPQLGQTIVTLRQEKKWTQEELVERCNVNVRTLQRIEAGEVTPRDYTIRAIFQALEYEFELFQEKVEKKFTLRKLHLAWVCGVVYFLLGLGELALDYWRFENPPAYFPLMYTSGKTVVAVTFVLFMMGFVEVGRHVKNNLLRVGAYLMLGSMVVVEFLDVITAFSGLSEGDFLYMKGAQAVAFGGVDILFGLGLIYTRRTLGHAALAAGILEILVGTFFITFFLAFIGLFFLIPTTLLEIVVLYKVYDQLRRE